MSKVDAFARDSKGQFLDHRKEAFAKACAKHGLAGKAAEETGVALPTGVKWRGTKEMAERIAALRAGAETFVGVSKAWVVDRLRQNAEDSAADGKFKESNDALGKIYSIINVDPDLKNDKGASGGDPAEMTAAELKELRKNLFPVRALEADTRTMVEDEDGVFSEEDEYEEDPRGEFVELGDRLPPLTKRYRQMAEDE